MTPEPKQQPPIDLTEMHKGMDEVGIAFSFVAHIDDPMQDSVPSGYTEADLRSFYISEAVKFLPTIESEAARAILEQTIASYRKKA